MQISMVMYLLECGVCVCVFFFLRVLDLWMNIICNCHFFFVCLFVFLHIPHVFGFLSCENWKSDRYFCGNVTATRLCHSCHSNVQTICWRSLEEDWDADITRGTYCYLLTYSVQVLINETPLSQGTSKNTRG